MKRRCDIRRPEFQRDSQALEEAAKAAEEAAEGAEEEVSETPAEDADKKSTEEDS
ncbi:hypothetical protein ACFL2S_14155 [Thermodesulfobacteriota bacterium]